VSKHSREEVQLSALKPARRHVVHVVLALQLEELVLLAGTTLVEQQYRFCLASFIGHDDLELVAFFMRGEQPQLHWFFALLFHPMTEKQESVSDAASAGGPTLVLASTWVETPVPAEEIPSNGMRNVPGDHYTRML